MRVTSKTYPKGLKIVGLVLSSQRDKIILIERIKKGKHYYVFPGGGVEDFDTNAKEALFREMREETNVKVRVICQPYELRIKGHTKQVVYICEYLSGNLELTGEEKNKNCDDDFYSPRWFKINDLFKMTVYPLEIRDWLLSDLKQGKWTKQKKEFFSFDELKN